MSVLRPLLSRRGRLLLAAVALLLMSALIVAPSMSAAKPPSPVKQFTAVIHPTTAAGGVPSTWKVLVTNCGFPVAFPCTAASTIGLGSIRITVPIEFRNAVTVSIDSAPTGKNWTVSSYNSSTGIATVVAVTGADRLGPGESVSIAIDATPDACAPGTKTFTTAAWGSASVPGSEPFAIQTPQPTVDVAPTRSCVTSGEPVTDDATGQTDTVSGDFTGHVNITFGGVAGDCGGPEFGVLGDQWQVYHQATPSTVTPANDFHAGGPKLWTTEFPLTTPPGASTPGDSSWYLTCYAVPQEGHTRFVSRGTVDGLAVEQTVGDVLSWVGILPSCGIRPCVSEQFLTTGQPNPAPPWTPSANKVHIAITVDPGDPHRS